MKIATQINCVVGDLDGNARLASDKIAALEAAGVVEAISRKA